MTVALSEDLLGHWIAVLFLVDLWLLGDVPPLAEGPLLCTVAKIIEGETTENQPDQHDSKNTTQDEGNDDLINNNTVSFAKLSIIIDSPEITSRLLAKMQQMNSVDTLQTLIAAVANRLTPLNTVTFNDNNHNNHNNHNNINNNDNHNDNINDNNINNNSNDNDDNDNDNNNNNNNGITPRRVHPSSFLGKFITKVVTINSILLFDERLLIYSSFVDYYGGSVDTESDIENGIGSTKTMDIQVDSIDSDESLFASLRCQLANANISMFEDISKTNLKSPIKGKNHISSSVTRQDLEHLLENQIRLLESNGTPTPAKLKQIMIEMTSPENPNGLTQNPEITNLPQWYYLQYLEALKDLDYHGATRLLHQYFDYMVLNNSKYFYHFALIQKAALHQHFGENESALASIEEAILVARENKDNSTLTYILLWLFNFMRTRPELWDTQTFYQSEQHLLDFLIARLQYVSKPLYLILYLFETLHYLNTGKSLSKVLESLIKATFIALNDTPNQALSKSFEFASSIWSKIGSPNLSNFYSLFHTDKNISDKLNLKLRRAYICYETGKVEETNTIIESLQGTELADRVVAQQIQLRCLILQTRMYLYRGRHAVALKMLEVLLNTNISDSEINLELVYLNSEAQLEFGNNYSALKFVSMSLNALEHQSVITNLHTLIRLRLLKAKILVSSGLPSKALLLVVQELKISKNLAMKSLVVESIIILASILNALGTYSDCYDLLEASMASIHSVGNIGFLSQAYYEFALSCFKLKSSIGLTYRGKKLIGKFLSFLNLSIDGFKKTLNLVMLRKCFELEKQLAISEGLSELEEHAINSLLKLNIRIQEEVKYGFVNDGGAVHQMVVEQ